MGRDIDAAFGVCRSIGRVASIPGREFEPDL
jgi:hypothetical protein